MSALTTRQAPPPTIYNASVVKTVIIGVVQFPNLFICPENDTIMLSECLNKAKFTFTISSCFILVLFLYSTVHRSLPNITRGGWRGGGGRRIGFSLKVRKEIEEGREERGKEREEGREERGKEEGKRGRRKEREEGRRRKEGGRREKKREENQETCETR